MSLRAYCIMVSDGTVFRTLHGPAFGSDRPRLEAMIRRAIEPPAAAPASTPATAPIVPASPGIDEPRVPRRTEAALPMMTQGEIARTQGFTGDSCTTCGGFSMRRNGTCLLCAECGATTGCS